VIPLESVSSPSRIEPGALGLSAANAGTASAARAAKTSAIRIMFVPPAKGRRNVLESPPGNPDGRAELRITVAQRAQKGPSTRRAAHPRRQGRRAGLGGPRSDRVGRPRPAPEHRETAL